MPGCGVAARAQPDQEVRALCKGEDVHAASASAVSICSGSAPAAAGPADASSRSRGCDRSRLGGRHPSAAPTRVRGCRGLCWRSCRVRWHRAAATHAGLRAGAGARSHAEELVGSARRGARPLSISLVWRVPVQDQLLRPDCQRCCKTPAPVRLGTAAGVEQKTSPSPTDRNAAGSAGLLILRQRGRGSACPPSAAATSRFGGRRFAVAEGVVVDRRGEALSFGHLYGLGLRRGREAPSTPTSQRL